MSFTLIVVIVASCLLSQVVGQYDGEASKGLRRRYDAENGDGILRQHDATPNIPVLDVTRLVSGGRNGEGTHSNGAGSSNSMVSQPEDRRSTHVQSQRKPSAGDSFMTDDNQSVGANSGTADENVSTRLPMTTDQTDIGKMSKREPDIGHGACKMHIANDSKETFTTEVLTKKYNFVTLHLSFDGFNVSETEDVIAPRLWTWTFAGEHGAYPYLRIPEDYGYLSLGLLYSYSRVSPLPVTIQGDGTCRNVPLTVGERATDSLIGQALGEMTSDLAKEDDSVYGSSHWCFFVGKDITPQALYIVCKYLVCPFQTVQYKCCKFVVEGSKRRVACPDDGYTYTFVWWFVPIIMGNFIFLFGPLILTKLAVLGTKYAQLKRHNSYDSSGYELADMSSDLPFRDHVFLTQIPPITFWSTLISPCLCCALSESAKSRLLRLAFIFLSLSFIGLKILLDGLYSYSFVVSAERKGILMYFSSLFAGWRHDCVISPSQCPGVYLGLYATLATLYLLIPNRLSQLLERGLPECTHNALSSLTLGLEGIEHFGGVEILNKSGYSKLYRVLKAQLFMVLNTSFWRSTFTLFLHRWRLGFSYLQQNVRSVIPFALLAFIALILYVVVVVLEIVLTAIVYGFSLFGFFRIARNAYSACAVQTLRRCLKRGVTFAEIVLNVLVSFLLSVVWFMFCIIFYSSLLYLCRLAMFTYTGIVAYPVISYGYFILALMTLYYTLESLKGFGETYTSLLKLCIKVCEALEDSDTLVIHEDGVTGIRKDLFYAVVDRHKPRRVEVVFCALKLAFVVFMTTVSVQLLVTFGAIQQLSLLSHVFTVIFICAVPKILSVFCGKKNRKSGSKKLRRNIEITICRILKERDKGTDKLPDFYMNRV